MSGIDIDTGRFREAIPGTIAQRRREGLEHTERKANRIGEHAQRIAPRLRRPDRRYFPGELASSIRVARISETAWEIAAWVRWAAFVEFGTARHGHAQPYMRPAVALVEVERI